MRIYLMRHGIAAERGDPEYPDDADRPLTDRGRRRTREAARGLAALGVRPKGIWTSPYARAAQTAAIVAEVLVPRADAVREEPLLTPGANDLELVGALAGSGVESLMLVGHEPDLSRLASLLLTGNADNVSISLKKAAVCVLDTTDLVRSGGAELVGLWQAAVMRALGRGGRGA